MQAIIPYTLSALADPAERVRRAAADVIVRLSKIAHQTQAGSRMWGFDDIYGKTNATKAVKWLSADQTAKILNVVILPSLEECILDSTCVESMLEKSLKRSKSAKHSGTKSMSLDLPKTLRAALMSFLSSHVINTPLYAVKLRLLRGLNAVSEVNNTSRTRILIPLLKKWAMLGSEEVHNYCNAEHLNEEDLDTEILNIVTANDHEGIHELLALLRGVSQSTRTSLVARSITRLRSLWQSFSIDMQMSVAQVLLDFCLAPDDDYPVTHSFRGEVMDLLRSVPLATEVLMSFVGQLHTVTDVKDRHPAAKKRRTSHEELAVSKLDDEKEVHATVQRITFVLQLVDSSHPEHRRDLLGPLFATLGELQHFKTQVSTELAYIQTLVLSSLLAIINAYKVR
jgi:U3 small nucleolar RNA-associated protein 10